MNTEESSEHTSEVEVQCENLEPPPWLPLFSQFLRDSLPTIDDRSWDISVILTSDERMRHFNCDFRGIDAPTDVLSFSQNEGEEIPSRSPRDTIAGDVVISLDSVRRNAEEFGVQFEEEIRRVAIHGSLHLAGYSHSEDASPEEPMIELQERVVARTEKLF